MAKNEEKTSTAVTDIDAWISGAELPEDEITLSSKLKAMTKAKRLRGERRRLLGANRVPGQMAGVDTEALDAEIEALDAEVEAGMGTFRIRGVERSKWNAIMKAHGKKEGDYVDEQLVAAALIDPKLDQPGVARLRTAIGEGQFMRLAKACNSLSFDSEPSVDF